jgi:hypothetical protein
MNDTKLDLVLSFLGLGTSIFIFAALLSLGVNQPLSLMFVLFLTFLYYIFKRDSLRRILLDDRGSPPVYIKKIPHLPIYVTIIMCLVNLIIVRQSSNAIIRPGWVFVAFSLSGILILIQIKFKVYKLIGGEVTIFIQLLILLITLLLSNISVFPYNGGDTWAHINNADMVSQSKFIDSVGGGYKGYPLFPVLIYLTSLVTGAGTDQSARMAVIFASLTCLILIYALSKSYFNSAQKGLLLVLTLLGSKWFIYWSTYVVSMSLAMLLFCAFYVLLNMRLFIKEEPWMMFLLYLVAIIMPFFHPAGAFAIILMSFIYMVTDSVFFSRDKKIKVSHLLPLVLFVVVITLTQWIYYGQTFTLAVRNLSIAIFQDTPDSIRLGTSLSDPITYILDNVNFYCFICLGLVEILRQIRLRQDRLTLYSGLCGVVFIAFAYLTQLINFQAALPYRWLLFGTLLLAIPAVNSLTYLIRIRSSLHTFFIVAGFGVLFFLGYANREINRDHPFYGIRATERYEVTSSEHTGMMFLLQNSTKFHASIRVDLRLWDFYKLEPSDSQISYWRKVDLKSQNEIISLRDVYDDHRIVFLGDSVDQLNQNTMFLNQFYDVGNLKWLDWVPNPTKNPE